MGLAGSLFRYPRGSPRKYPKSTNVQAHLFKSESSGLGGSDAAEKAEEQSVAASSGWQRAGIL